MLGKAGQQRTNGKHVNPARLRLELETIVDRSIIDTLSEAAAHCLDLMGKESGTVHLEVGTSGITVVARRKGFESRWLVLYDDMIHARYTNLLSYAADKCWSELKRDRHE